MDQTDGELLSAIDSLRGSQVLVFGDLMLDRYTWGNADRISPEGPVIVLTVRRQEDRLGGAAAVAQLLSGLEAKVHCVSVLGVDAPGVQIRSLLHQAAVSDRFVALDESRFSTIKERFIGLAEGRHANQILRVDRELREPISAATEATLKEHLIIAVRQSEAVVISDYGKGVCTEQLCQAVIAESRSAGIPVIVDPARGVDFARYQGASAITPNRDEASIAIGKPIASVEGGLEAARSLRTSFGLDFAIVTLDRDGIVFSHLDGSDCHFGTRPQSVYDITGAGDMVLAMLGACFARRHSPQVGIQLANLAAGLEIQRLGVAAVTLEELRRQCGGKHSLYGRKIATLLELVLQVQEHRAAGRTIALANGCFDLLHRGHLRYLSDAAALADILVVGVNSDSSVQRLKGPHRPIMNQGDRAAMLAALGFVDHVVIFEEETPHRVLDALRPDFLVKGGDYTHSAVIGADFVESYGGRVCLTGYVDGISTTRVLDSVESRGIQLNRTKCLSSENQPSAPY